MSRIEKMLLTIPGFVLTAYHLDTLQKAVFPNVHAKNAKPGIIRFYTLNPTPKTRRRPTQLFWGKRGHFLAGVLPTAIVTIEDQASNTHTCRALHDTGSHINLISEEAAQRVGMK